MTELRAGELVWAPIPFQRRGEETVEVKTRPAVVLRVKGAEALVAWGTSTARELPRVAAEPRERVGIALRLQNTTYFYEKNVRWIASADAERRPESGTLAPPEFLARVLELTVR